MLVYLKPLQRYYFFLICANKWRKSRHFSLVNGALVVREKTTWTILIDDNYDNLRSNQYPSSAL